MQPSRGISAKTQGQTKSSSASQPRRVTSNSHCLELWIISGPAALWWGIPPSLPSTVNTGSCTGTQQLQRRQQPWGSAAPDPSEARETPTGADASVEVLESGQISLEISLFPSSALMSFAELPAGLGIPGGRAPRVPGSAAGGVRANTSQRGWLGLANQAAATSCTHNPTENPTPTLLPGKLRPCRPSQKPR